MYKTRWKSRKFSSRFTLCQISVAALMRWTKCRDSWESWRSTNMWKRAMKTALGFVILLSNRWLEIAVLDNSCAQKLGNAYPYFNNVLPSVVISHQFCETWLRSKRWLLWLERVRPVQRDVWRREPAEEPHVYQPAPWPRGKGLRAPGARTPDQELQRQPVPQYVPAEPDTPGIRSHFQDLDAKTSIPNSPSLLGRAPEILGYANSRLSPVSCRSPVDFWLIITHAQQNPSKHWTFSARVPLFHESSYSSERLASYDPYYRSICEDVHHLISLSLVRLSQTWSWSSFCRYSQRWLHPVVWLDQVQRVVWRRSEQEIKGLYESSTKVRRGRLLGARSRRRDPAVQSDAVRRSVPPSSPALWPTIFLIELTISVFTI